MINTTKYIEKRNKNKAEFTKEPGPVITISREYGCSGRNFAMHLAEKINSIKNINHDWTWINKEVFVGTAEALNLKKEKILHIFEGKSISTVDSIILSGDENYYKSDRIIQEKIIEIVRAFAESGNVIIIGLASAIITRDIEKSLHIRLHAPFEWRVKNTAKEKNISLRDTIKHAIKIDQNRKNLKKIFKNKKAYKELFDISFNVMTMPQDEIIDTVISVMKGRKMV